jgi:hypothetical protein
MNTENQSSIGGDQRVIDGFRQQQRPLIRPELLFFPKQIERITLPQESMAQQRSSSRFATPFDAGNGANASMPAPTLDGVYRNDNAGFA